MPHQNQERLFTVLGFVIWGDLGPTTIYRNKKGKVVFFAKTWPHKPPSPKQLIWQTLFTAAAAAWKTLTPDARLQWETATRRASLCCNGYDLFVHWYIEQDDLAMQTLERQTRTLLLPP